MNTEVSIRQQQCQNPARPGHRRIIYPVKSRKNQFSHTQDCFFRTKAKVFHMKLHTNSQDTALESALKGFFFKFYLCFPTRTKEKGIISEVTKKLGTLKHLELNYKTTDSYLISSESNEKQFRGSNLIFQNSENSSTADFSDSQERSIERKLFSFLVFASLFTFYTGQR